MHSEQFQAFGALHIKDIKFSNKINSLMPFCKYFVSWLHWIELIIKFKKKKIQFCVTLVLLLKYFRDILQWPTILTKSYTNEKPDD